MKVLLSTHHLVQPGGTETLTATVAECLTQAGMEVTIYCPLVREEFLRASEIRVPVVSSIELLAGQHFDLAHVNHNLNALEIRTHFPDLPMIWVANGVIPFLEQPAPFSLGLSRCLAVSEEVRDHVLSLEPSLEVSIWRNPVNEAHFRPFGPVRETPRSALFLSSGMSTERAEMIGSVCAARGISCRFAGRRFEWIGQLDLPAAMNEADIVFGLGRRAVEAMLCGRTAFVLDEKDGDGIVSAHNFVDLMTHNFSGRRLRRSFDACSLERELDLYSAGSSESLRDLAMEHFGAAGRIKELVDHYSMAIKLPPEPDLESARALRFVSAAIAETRLDGRQNPLPRKPPPAPIPDPSLAHAGLRRLLSMVDIVAPPGSRFGSVLRRIRRAVRTLLAQSAEHPA